MGNNNKKRIKKKSKKKNTIKIFILFFIFMGEFFVYAGIRVECMHIKYKISKAKQIQKKLESYKKTLILEKERLGSPERIHKIATTRLNLSVPKHNQIIYMY